MPRSLPGDPLGWSDKKSYPVKLAGDREKSGLSEAVVCGFGQIGGRDVALGVMDFNFRGGTMGTVVGERIALLFEEARKRRVPAILFTASGGARMEEGMLALMQMAKTTATVARFMDAGNSLHRRPDRSDHRRRFGLLCLPSRHHRRRAEGHDRLRRPQGDRANGAPKAARQFQTAEFLWRRARSTWSSTGTSSRRRSRGPRVHDEARVVNPIVDREKGLLELEKRIAELRSVNASQPVDMSPEIAALEAKYQEILREVFGSLTPWMKVHMARHPSRPTSWTTSARSTGSTNSTATASSATIPRSSAASRLLHGRPVMAIGEQRGRDTKENLLRNFGMPSPEGYRKVGRLAHLASRLGLPIVTFVDTKGADPGITSEEHAQSEAIAKCLLEFTRRRVPIVATVIGEGGSGGALALAIADRVIMLEHSTYSVASPDACAAILWSDASKAEEAASRLKLTAQDLERFGVIDEIVPEPLGGAHRDPAGGRRARPCGRRRRRRQVRRADPGAPARGALSEVSQAGIVAGLKHRRPPRHRRRSRASLLLRLAGRITASAVALLVFTLIGVQFARVIGENVAMASQLSGVNSDISALQARRQRQLRELLRLRDPEGAVPEIHDRLRLVRPNEAIIFVSPAPSASP